MKRLTSKNAGRLLLIIGGVLLLVGLGLGWYQRHQSKQVVSQASSAQPAPDSTKPTPAQVDNYTVAPDLPRYITISKINIKARVMALGVTKDNQIDAPGNVHDAGWYNKSSKPGNPGAMLIDGHVSSWEANGVFHDLSKLRPGDTVQIEKGDKSSISYRVVKSQTYDADKVDMNEVLAPVNGVKNGLNLITCAGKVIKGTNQFDKRVVVFTEQI
jgi:LPXTG-site transpeptidase (sortase) family protein